MSDSKPQSFIARMRAKLNRPGSWLSYDLANLVPGRQIDAEVLDELETRLLTADVGVEATQVHPRRAAQEGGAQGARRRRSADRGAARRDRGDPRALREAADIDRRTRPFVIMVVGVNGSGKTTSIGKLARALRRSGQQGDAGRRRHVPRGRRSSSSTSGRSAAAPTSSSSRRGADPGAVVFDALQPARARGIDVLIADTAGRLHSQSHLMEELKKVRRVIQRVDPTAPHEVLLVLDANQGQNALAQAMQFHAAVGVTGLVLTKLDGTAQGRHRGRHRAQAGPADPLTSASASRPRISANSTPRAFADALSPAIRAARVKSASHDPFRRVAQALPQRPRGAQRASTSRSQPGEMVFLTGAPAPARARSSS